MLSASVLGVPVGAALIAVAVFIVYLPCATGEEAGVLARVQGQTALAKQIEDWLNSYRTGPSDPRTTRPPTESVPRSP
jgi:hypothetical protein